MPSVYPGALDTLTNPQSTDRLTSPSHADQHANANDAIEAIQATLGVDPQGSEATVSARIAALEGGGGGAVDSVNGQTGVVVLDASDVGAVDLDVVRPGVLALDSDTIVVDWGDASTPRLLTRTAAGAVTLDADGYAADLDVTVVITNGTAGDIAVTAVGAWVWLTDQPTTLAAGERGVLSLLSTTAAEGGTFAAWAVEA